MTVRIERGRILTYRLYDIGDEIDLVRAKDALDGTLGPPAAGPALGGPTVIAPLGERTLTLSRTGRALLAALSVRLFDYGAASVRLDVPLETEDDGIALLALVPLCDEIYDSPEIERLARTEIEQLLARLGDAVKGPHRWPGFESYTVLFVERFVDGAPVERVLETGDLAKLLLGETSPEPVSALEQEDVTKHAFQYLEGDLAVIDWTSALVVQPGGERTLPELLEFATSHLLQLRYYDDLIDAELNRVYDRFAAAKRTPWVLFSNPYADLARGVLKRLLELTEFTERVDNLLKVIGDFYLGRVYQATVRRFRIPTWQASVYRKLGLLTQVYALLKGETDVRRTTLLEAAIVLLIVFEIVFAFIR